MSTSAPKVLPRRLRDLVGADRQLASRVGALTDDELRELASLAAGRDVATDVPVSRARALTALGDRAPADVAVPVLREVATDPARDVVDRLAAVRALARADAQASQVLLGLVTNAEGPDADVVRGEALDEIGRIGGPELAAPLAGVPAPDDDRLARRLVLARALVGHRAGDGSVAPRSPGPAPTTDVPPGDRSEVRLQLASPRRTARDVDSLRGSLYGLQPGERALELDCGPARWVVLVDHRLGPSPDTLLARPMVTAVLAQRLPEGRSLTTRLVVLSRPERPADDGRAGKAAARLDVVRPDGEVVYSGRATPLEDGVRLVVRDTDRPGRVPTHLTLQLLPGGDVRMESAEVATTRQATRSTSDVRVD